MASDANNAGPTQRGNLEDLEGANRQREGISARYRGDVVLRVEFQRHDLVMQNETG